MTTDAITIDLSMLPGEPLPFDSLLVYGLAVDPEATPPLVYAYSVNKGGTPLRIFDGRHFNLAGLRGDEVAGDVRAVLVELSLDIASAIKAAAPYSESSSLSERIEHRLYGLRGFVSLNEHYQLEGPVEALRILYEEIGEWETGEDLLTQILAPENDGGNVIHGEKGDVLDLLQWICDEVDRDDVAEETLERLAEVAALIGVYNF